MKIRRSHSVPLSPRAVTLLSLAPCATVVTSNSNPTGRTCQGASTSSRAARTAYPDATCGTPGEPEALPSSSSSGICLEPEDPDNEKDE